MPMGVPACLSVNPSHKLSLIVKPVPSATPHLASLPSTCNGAMLMFSLPPHMTTFASPNLIDLAPCITVSKPEPHSRLIVNAGTPTGTPTLSPTCRARYAASELDWITLPKYTASMVDGSILPLVMADFVDTTPSSVAVRDLSDPPKAPNGVRLAATMKMLDMMLR